MRRLFFLILFIASPVLAEPIDALKPMGFLAGHCWKGGKDKDTDEHCFQFLLDGKALRDLHTVRSPGKPDYVGETTYYWNAADKKIEFLYVENAGGFSRGTLVKTADGFDFPPTKHIANGEEVTYKAHWAVKGDKEYEVTSEFLTDKGWVPVIKTAMIRQP